MVSVVQQKYKLAEFEELGEFPHSKRTAMDSELEGCTATGLEIRNCHRWVASNGTAVTDQLCQWSDIYNMPELRTRICVKSCCCRSSQWSDAILLEQRAHLPLANPSSFPTGRQRPRRSHWPVPFKVRLHFWTGTKYLAGNGGSRLRSKAPQSNKSIVPFCWSGWMAASRVPRSTADTNRYQQISETRLGE